MNMVYHGYSIQPLQSLEKYHTMQDHLFYDDPHIQNNVIYSAHRIRDTGHRNPVILLLDHVFDGNYHVAYTPVNRHFCLFRILVTYDLTRIHKNLYHLHGSSLM